MSSTSFVIRRNDTAPPITATLQAGTPPSPVDLTGASVRFHMKETSGDVDGAPLKVDAAATLVSAGDGTVKYDWQPEDTDSAGWFRAEWEVTFPDGTIRTFPSPSYTTIRITGDLA